ncbi:CapA family protein [Saccharicrinis sp. FJH62]|uniref:CapA family protein n=1 Tax=Saccharicrinis sp. FJH62 TaxID=3344657 RepID=UPI0035D48148
MLLNLIGDIAFTGLLSLDSERNYERTKSVIPVNKVADLVLANLEVPLLSDKNDKNSNKNFIHYSLKEPSEELLKYLSISCVSLANNHIFDCGMSGLKETVNMLDQLGISHTGAGWKKEHLEPVIVESDGIKIGFIAYVDKSTNPKTESFRELYINYLEEDRITETLKVLKQKVDIIICSLHWGVDYSYYPTNEQVKFARRIIDQGATIIMGHHPHTIQPYEKYGNGIIFYSLGGLTFGDFYKHDKLIALYKKTKRSVIAKLDVSKNRLEFNSVKELKGNYLKLDQRDFEKWSKRKWKYYRVKNSNAFLKRIFIFKENVLDRINEYFFGYYQNPVKRLFQLGNIKKLKRLFT